MVDPLGLELQTAVSPHMNAGTLTLGPLEEQMRHLSSPNNSLFVFTLEILMESRSIN